MTDRILWFECYSGISGDMAVAAMLDLGADENAVMKAVNSLGLDAGIVIGRKIKSGIDAMDFDVRLPEDNHSERGQSRLVLSPSYQKMMVYNGTM